nr:vesicle-associated protein 4-2-like [Coffea arabica]
MQAHFVYSNNNSHSSCFGMSNGLFYLRSNSNISSNYNNSNVYYSGSTSSHCSKCLSNAERCEAAGLRPAVAWLRALPKSSLRNIFKFLEPPESNDKLDGLKSRVKFKIMRLNIKGDMDYVPELFDEHRDQVAVEQILRVIFILPPALEKLNRQLAEAEAKLEVRKRPPPEDKGLRVLGEGLVFYEWKEMRERYLARQLVKGLIQYKLLYFLSSDAE